MPNAPHESPPRLRVAVAAERDGQLPRWAGQVLEQLSASEFATIALVIEAAHDAHPAGLAWRLYDRTLGRVPSDEDDPLELRDSRPVLAGVPRVPAMPDALRSHQIDVVICPGRADARAAAGARYGAWQLQPGADARDRQAPPFFQEARDGDPVSVISLIAHLPGEPQPVVVDSASFATVRDIQAGMNRIAPYVGGARLFVENLRRVHAQGLAGVRARWRPFETNGEVRRDPGALELLRWIVPEATAKLMRRLRGSADLTIEWRIAIRRGGDILGAGADADMSGFHFLDAPRGHFYADPFPVLHDAVTWLFFEDYVFASRRAVLACGRLTDDNRLEDVRVILERPYHLSYPLVFQHDGGWWLLPESKANGTVDLYAAERFPYDWRLATTLFRGSAADTSVWFEDGLCWFFSTLVDPGGRGMALRLFSSERLAGEWRPHPANPITRDVRHARGAGAIFRRHGRLYRPSQDCAWDYGAAFALNEIVTLTPDRYDERQVLAVTPHWDPELHGTHTYNRAGDVEVIDASRLVRRSTHEG